MADQGIYNLLVDVRGGVANLQQDMNKAVSILQSSGGRMSQVMTGIAQGIGQAFGKYAVDGVVNLTRAVGALADKGEEVGSIVENFKKLGGSSQSIEAARKAVLGTVSAFDLMKVANEGIAKGIPNLNKNFASLVEYAGRFADATGRDTVEVLNQLTQAISTGSNKALAEFGIQVDQSGTRAQKMAEAIAQVGTNMGNFAELTDSVSNAHKGFSVAMDDALKSVGMGINENEQLIGVYRELEEAIHSIDWQELGGNIAGMVASVVSVLPTLQTVVAEINKVAAGMRLVTGNLGPVEQANRDVQKIQTEIALMKTNRDDILDGGGDTGVVDMAIAERLQRIEKLKDGMADLQREAERTSILSDPASNPGAPFPLNRPPSQAVFGGGGGGSRGGSPDQAAKRELDAKLKAEKQLQDEKEKQAEALVKLEYGSRKAYEAESEKNLEASVDGWGNAFQQVFSSQILGLDSTTSQLATDFASQIATGLFSDLQDNHGGMVGLGQSIAEGLGDGMKSLFGDDGLAGIGMTTTEAHQAGVQGPGQQDGTFNGAATTASNYFLGSGMSTQEAHEAGVQGPGMQDGSFGKASGPNSSFGAANFGGYLQAATTVVTAASEAKDIDKKNKDNSGTGKAVGAAVGAVIGAIIAAVFSFGIGAGGGAVVGGAIGSVLGGTVGKWIPRGAQNKQTISRHAFANYIEDDIEKKGAYTVYDQQNKNPTKLTNFLEGPSTRFNDPKWSDELLKQSDKVKSTFLGLGEGLRAVLGITEEVGSQMAATLGDNLKFNIDNARHMVKRLGISFDDIKKSLVEIGLKGDKTWLEINTQIAGVAEAFKPGLAAVGDFATAFDHLMTSGARGFEAVQSIRDIGVEASEAGIKDFEALRQQLLKTYDPATVDAFFQALKQRGVGSIKELADLSDEKAGSIVGDMQALGAKFTDTGDRVTDGLSANTSSTDENTAALRENTRAQGTEPAAPAPADDTAEVPFAKGGVVHGPTRALMGENGPEAILPLTRRNGRLGVAMFGNISGNGGGGGYMVHVDARNASPGVEKSVRSALMTSERRVMTAVGRAASRRARRTT